MEQFLHNLPIFHGVEISEIKSLLVFLTAQRKSYKKGEIILSEGETTDCIGVVLSGLAMLQLGDIWGKYSVVGSVRPGGTLSEAYVCLPDEPLMIHVVAAEAVYYTHLDVYKRQALWIAASNSARYCANSSLLRSAKVVVLRGWVVKHGKLKGKYSFFVRLFAPFAENITGISRTPGISADGEFSGNTAHTSCPCFVRCAAIFFVYVPLPEPSSGKWFTIKTFIVQTTFP